MSFSEVKFFLNNVGFKKNKMVITGSVISSQSIPEHQYMVILRSRVSSKEVKKTCIINNKSGNRYLFKAIIELSDLSSNTELKQQEHIYDVYLYNSHTDNYYRLGNPAYNLIRNIKDGSYRYNDVFVMFSPYFTFKKRNLSIKITSLGASEYRFMRIILLFSGLLRALCKFKDIWLIGELDYKAQDNGQALYNYITENYPNKKVYYVINKSSKEKKNLKNHNNVIDFYTKKHIFYLIVATRIITTHHPSYIYPVQLKKYKKRIKGKKIFLTHGIFGVKNMYKNYGNYINDFKVDHVIANSDFQKKIIIRDLKYKSKQVSVTGFPRLDTLFDFKSSPRRDVLIMPTWRDWLLTREDFRNSEYYKKFKELLSNKIMNDLIKEHNLTVTLCLHPNFREYTSFFEQNNIKVIFQGDENVQALIKDHKLMITDYSSVAFDFSFLDRPVIFYQFDLKRFVGQSKSHIKIPEDLPGTQVVDVEEVVLQLESYIRDKFKVDEKKDKVKLIKFVDVYSSERTYQACKGAKKSNKRAMDNGVFNILRIIKNKVLSTSFRKY